MNRIEFMGTGESISELLIILEHKKLAFGWVTEIGFRLSGPVEDGIVFGKSLFGFVELSVFASASWMLEHLIINGWVAVGMWVAGNVLTRIIYQSSFLFILSGCDIVISLVLNVQNSLFELWIDSPMMVLFFQALNVSFRILNVGTIFLCLMLTKDNLLLFDRINLIGLVFRQWLSECQWAYFCPLHLLFLPWSVWLVLLFRFVNLQLLPFYIHAFHSLMSLLHFLWFCSWFNR